MTKTQEIKLMIIENFIDHYTSHIATGEKMKVCARDYVKDDHVDEIAQAYLTIDEDVQKLINKYTERLKILKENFAKEIDKLTDAEKQDFENQIRLTAEIIKDLK